MVVQWTARFPQPTSIEEAERRQAELKVSVSQVMRQLTESGGKPLTGEAAQWRRRAVLAHQVICANLGLLKRWLAAERSRVAQTSPTGRPVRQLLIEASGLFGRLVVDRSVLNEADAALLSEIETRAADLVRREKHDGQTQVVPHVQPA